MYIYHHLGLGDHIICNSIVRHYATIFDEVIVFCKNHNRYSVEHLYFKLFHYRQDSLLPIYDELDETALKMIK
jgi:hypothetical protein